MMTSEELLAKIKAQDFGANDSQIVSALRNPKKAGEILADWLKSHTDDYKQLYSAYPSANKFGAMLKENISKNIPSNEDFQSPKSMGEWSLSAALNAPMAGTFIGPKAANWDKKAAATATQLLDNGVDPAQVWKEHLIGRMPDKSLFSEIDDSVATAIPNKDWSWASSSDYKLGNNPLGPLKEFFTHKPLKSNYKGFFDKGPDDKEITAIIKRFSGESGSYHDGNITVGDIEYLNPDFSGTVVRANKSTMLHELQHAIQDREGWAKGGSPNTMMAEATPELKYKAYRRLTGEAQSRATQDRMNLNMQQRRDSYPLAKGLLADIKLKDLINRYGN